MSAPRRQLELDLRAHLELELIVIALLAWAPIPCAVCGWATSADRRQLELELWTVDEEAAHEIGYADPVCEPCERRGAG